MKNYLILVFLTVALAFVSCQSDTKTTSTDSNTTESQRADNESTTSDVVPAIEPAMEPIAAEGGPLDLRGVLGDAKTNDGVELLKIIYKKNAKPRPIARAKVSSDGSYKFNIKNPGNGVYGLKLGKEQLLFLLGGDEKEVLLNVAKGGFRTLNVDIKGANDNHRYYTVMKGISNKTMNAEALVEMLKMEKNPLLASLIALQVLPDPSFRSVHQSILNKLKATKSIDRDNYTSPYEMFVAGMPVSIQEGEQAPDLVFQDPKGKTRKLSDLKGKLVLLDFWASWCGPCRKANPEVVKIYKKYKNKGFTIFSVSLDGDRNGNTNANVLDMHHKRWVDAIQKDGLEWPDHVSDLKSWNSAAAAIYGVTSIPATYLIGRDGKIVAVNVRGRLEALVKKNL